MLNKHHNTVHYNKKNKFFHGIMFHHFHDKNIHTPGQGSISSDELSKIIKFVGRENIIDADEFYLRLKENKLKNNHLCLTFDDAIKSQFDVALPVLEDFKIKAFFFIYTSIFDNRPDNLEIFRFFRINFYLNINDFYKEFYLCLNIDLNLFFNKFKKEILYRKKQIPHLSIEDIKFRFVRDRFLSKKKYEDIMFKLINKKNFDYKKYYSRLFFSREDIKQLDSLNHIIGLHTHTHPTLLENLKYDDQKLEYERCINSISQILNKSKKLIKSMSHPTGSYNLKTLEILKTLGIEIGFKSTMQIEKDKGMSKVNNTNLEIARETHPAIIRLMNK